MRLAEQAGVRHPAHHGVDVVMTTDMVVDVVDGAGRREIPVAVKYAGDLHDPRTVEKLELERRFWIECGRPWTLVTELDLDADRTKVALWRQGWHTFDHLDSPYPDYWSERCEVVLRALALTPDVPLLGLIASLERDHRFATGDGLTVIRHLLAVNAIDLAGAGGFSPRGSTSQLVIVGQATYAAADREAA